VDVFKDFIFILGLYSLLKSIFTGKTTSIALILLSMDQLKKSDIVRFLPEYQDGENEFDYVLIEEPMVAG